MTKTKSKYSVCLCHASNVLARSMTKLMDEELAVLNLTSSYAYLLMEVAAQDKINPKKISESLELTPSTVTRLIEKMENRNLLQRKQVGRSTEVSLTKEGKSIMKQIKICIERFEKRYAALIGEELIDKLTKDVYEAAMKVS